MILNNFVDLVNFLNISISIQWRFKKLLQISELIYKEDYEVDPDTGIQSQESTSTDKFTLKFT